MITLVAASVLAASLVGVPTSAAAAPTCQGERATLVGRPDGVVEGTHRRDVVVTNGASYTRTYDGDDLVCVTNGRTYSEVDTRGGDDVVVVLSARGRVSFYAGTGADVFRGGSEKNSVLTDDGGDDIRTGAGQDDVEPTFTGPPSTIDLGPGRDDLLVARDVIGGSGAAVDAGDGQDVLRLSLSTKAAVRLDNVTERLEVGGQDTGLHWSSFEEFGFGDMRTPLLAFQGSSVAETVRLDRGHRGAHDYSLAMGDGNDLVRTLSSTAGEVDGGPGRDAIRTGPDVDHVESFTADLVAGTAVASYADGTRAWSLAGVEDVQARAAFGEGYPAVTLRGDDGPNRLVAKGCDVTVEGRGGDDRILARGSGCDSFDGDRRPRAVLSGGGGDDRMVGTRGRDLLDGGDGTDTADGGDRRDTCYAESVVRCELP